MRKSNVLIVYLLFLAGLVFPAQAGHIDVSSFPSDVWVKEPGIRLDFGGDPAGTTGFHTPYVFRLPDGTLRMYYDAFGSSPRQMKSAVSVDGITWAKEPGIRLIASQVGTNSFGHPHVLEASPGLFRMYFEAFGNRVMSATSADGLTWTVEPGIRLTNALDPVVIEEPGGGFRMYFRIAGSTILGTAPSADGLTFGVKAATGVSNAREFGAVRLCEGTVVIYYGLGTPAFQEIRSARSTDGINFIPDPGPRLVVGGHPDSDPLDSGGILTTSLVQFPGDVLRMYYQGSPGSINNSARVFSAVAVNGENPCVCEADPHTQGYWHRQCMGAGLILPGRNGRGPTEILEPDFLKDLVPAVDLQLQATVFETRTCEDGINADPPNDPCERAMKQYTALLLNRESDRLQDQCEIDLSAEGCSSTNIGDLVNELAGLINSQDPDNCKQAADCAGAVNEGIGIILPASSGVPVSSDRGLDTSGDPDPDPTRTPVSPAPGLQGRAQARSTSTFQQPEISPGIDNSLIPSPVWVPTPGSEAPEEGDFTEFTPDVEDTLGGETRGIKDFERHLAVLTNASSPEKARIVSEQVLLTALGGGYDPQDRLRIIRVLMDEVEVPLHSLLSKHLEDIGNEAEELGMEALEKEAETLLKTFERFEP